MALRYKVDGLILALELLPGTRTPESEDFLADCLTVSRHVRLLAACFFGGGLVLFGRCAFVCFLRQAAMLTLF